ncbi:MAG TPA: TMEM175 family protein [Methanoregula sp.]|nr:TMEM175 family protein [Methanoregula sp.]
MVDGIFAIAMTILVLGITPPQPDISQAQAVLTAQIIDLFPEFFIFIISFLILAGFWLGHHRQFHFVRVIDSRLLWINIFLLSSLVFIPFSTDVAGDYPDILIAVLLFHVNIIIIGLIFSYHVHYISRSKNLCDPNTDKKFLHVQFHRSILITGIAFIAAIISFVNPSVSLLVYLVVPVAGYYVRQSGARTKEEV